MPIGSPYPAEIVVTRVEYVHDYVIAVWFADGFRREVDLVDDLFGRSSNPCATWACSPR